MSMPTITVSRSCSPPKSAEMKCIPTPALIRKSPAKSQATGLALRRSTRAATTSRTLATSKRQKRISVHESSRSMTPSTPSFPLNAETMLIRVPKNPIPDAMIPNTQAVIPHAKADGDRFRYSRRRMVPPIGASSPTISSTRNKIVLQSVERGVVGYWHPAQCRSRHSSAWGQPRSFMRLQSRLPNTIRSY